ncbi:Glyoxylate reductase [Fusarium albosuccineum]|uniref:Glyoxylate reductase n=1 Tax=Fusarium albosuccineum TaxID=1237068 RepID=A0A8H4PDN7_9HYPO|nr:Glyoxylate reductase [Fusarium albosuccineum]
MSPATVDENTATSSPSSVVGKSKKPVKERVRSPSITVHLHSAPLQVVDEDGEDQPVRTGGLSKTHGAGPIPAFSSRASPEPGESGREGHFVGASSGLGFLLRLQRRLRKNNESVTETSVFTLGDPVLPEFDETAFIPPTREQATSLMKTYFELSSPTYSNYAVIMTMFAQATQYTDSRGDGMLYFQAAERRLSRETEPATLTSVQALLGCCFYVLTQSRLNHCWSLFGTTSRLILALGMHRRKAKFEGASQVGARRSCFIESECRKRVFWCAYNLDKYLGAIFGRPCAFHDDDIDQDMPSLVEDRDLKTDSMAVTDQVNMNVMLGPLSHQKLARILSSIMRRLYGIRALDRQTRYRTMAELGAQVEDWKTGLPAFLNPEKVDSRLLLPLFQRQSNLLSLASGHCLILLYRPCLFNDYSRRRDDQETKANIQKCLDAAMTIVTVIDYMSEAKQFYASSWFSHYQAFCAVVVLYTFTIRSRLDDGSTWQEYFKAAERCQSLITNIARADSLAQRFSVIMEEYRLEVLRQIQHNPVSLPTMPTRNPYQQQQSDSVTNSRTLQEESSSMVPLPTAMFQSDASSWLSSGDQENNSPLDFMDLPNWEQLDSLALDLGDILPDFSMIDPGAPFGP